MRVAIIGAGASGLLSSIFLAKANFKVDIFESGKKVARKILASGNGRCNISNKNISQNNFFGENPNFVNYAINKFGFIEFQDFCKSISLFLDIKDDGRVYPLSNESKSVSSKLERVAKSFGAKIFLETKIDKIQKIDSKFILNSKFVNYDYLIIATGSNSASHLGGDILGYEIAESFGHKIEKLYPSLAQLQINEKNLFKASGVRIHSNLKTFINGNLKNEIQGDILFTKYGLSGFAVLDSSQIISKAISDRKNVEINLDFFPNFSKIDLEKLIISQLSNNSIENLESILPQKLLNIILDKLKITELNSKFVKIFVEKVKNYNLKVSDTNGFKSAEVSGGGVSTENINSNSCESQIVKNLFFTGEILDIVGERGGYNLHFAWASGFIASQYIINSK